MPTYSYRCTQCRYELDLFQKISEPPATLCPNCNAQTLQRGIGGGQAIFQFKGKGFYQTDYKSTPQQTGESCPSS